MFYYLLLDGDKVVGYLVSTTSKEIPNSVEVTEQEFVQRGFSTSPSENSQTRKLESVEEENKLLKAQLQAQTERSDFIEDCIAEMATQVYGNV